MSQVTFPEPQEQEIERATAILKAGGLVAFPTETYYGLAVDPLNEQALARLFRVKKRPRIKPVLVLLADQEQLGLLAVDVPDIAYELMAHFWPGPLTLVLKAHPGLPDLLTGETATVGVRQSPHPLAAALVRSFGSPLTATSANRSGKEAALTVADVRRTFGPEIDLVLDGGPAPGRAGSTLIGLERGRIRRIREGCITFQEIERIVNTI